MSNVTITQQEINQLGLKSEPPKKCFNCKWDMKRMNEKYGVGFLQFGDFFQCPHCNAINGNIHAAQNTRKVRAFLKAKSESRLITPDGKKIINLKAVGEA